MSQNTGCGCSCQGGTKLVFSCSGSADVGLLADRVGRKLNSEGKAKMFCLAGIGGRVSGIMETTRTASWILVIDGCPLACGKKSLDEAGFTNYSHLQLDTMGYAKGKTEVTEEVVDKLAAKAATMLG